MINEEDVQTFSILDIRTIVLSELMNRKKVRYAKKILGFFFFGLSCCFALLTKFNSLSSDAIIITSGALVGFLVYLIDFGFSEWIEFDKVTKRCTVYKDISKKKIINSLAYGEYVFNHHNMGTTPLVSHCVTLHAADDPKAHRWYTYIKGFGYYVTEEEIESFRVRLVTALENWFDNKPYDKAIIRHASERDIIR